MARNRGGPQITPAPASARDIAYIILDDLGFAWLGCYGGPINTPNIDTSSAGYKKKNCRASYM
jgi:hypothetical protein